MFALIATAIAPASLHDYDSAYDSQDNEGLDSIADLDPAMAEDHANPGIDQGAKGDIQSSEQSIDEHMSKIHPSLLDRVGGKGDLKVFVATTNVAEVARTLQDYNYRGFIGQQAAKSDKIVVPLIEVPSAAIPVLASLPEVIAIFEYSPPQKHSYEGEEPFGLDTGTLNLNSTMNHMAIEAWENNFTGDGIQVAVIDDGVDFAHPDLQGTQARIESIYSVENDVVLASASGGELIARIMTPFGTPILPMNYSVYKNTIKIFEPADYTLNTTSGNITFTSPLMPSDSISADYGYYSPYYNWPIAYDPFSMQTYLSTKDATDTWYTSTNTTDNNVSHTIRMDGTNDFWRDGSELVAVDVKYDMISNFPFIPDEGNDFDMVGLYVTHDLNYWYIGIESFANQTNMTFGIYINTTAPGGATNDPLGNYVNATQEHLPEFAIYVEHNGRQANWNQNDTLENATIHKWNETNGQWENEVDLADPSVGGEQAYSRWKPKKAEGFIELKVPKVYLNDDGNISLIAFTTGKNPSQPQDTVDTDPAVNLPIPDLSNTTVVTLTSFTVVGNGYWYHTYNPALPISGRLNLKNRSWPTEYVVTNTSKSGTYYFGNMPDKNYPQTRVLVVDEAMSGVYDTIYMDLDHNKDFNNDKPNKRLGKYDKWMFWHDLNWTGNGTVYSEMVYADYYDSVWGATSIDYAPNGTFFATGSNDHTIIIWSAVDYKSRNVLDAHMGRVSDIDFSPNGSYIAASYDDASGRGNFNVVVWNFTTGNIYHTFVGHQDSVTSVVWSPNGTEIASSSLDGTVKIWNFTPRQLVKTFDSGEPVVAMDWSSLEKIAVSANTTVKLWNSSDSEMTLPTEITMTKEVASLAFNPNGTWLGVGEHEDLVQVINVSSGTHSGGVGLGGHSGLATINSISWSVDGTRFVTTSTSTAIYTIVKWIVLFHNDFSIGPRKTKDTAHDSKNVLTAIFSLNDQYILSGGLQDKYVKIWKESDLDVCQLPCKAIISDHIEGMLDHLSYNTGDGLADISGGAIYYIATSGIPIPYSDSLTERLVGVENNVIPDNGQLVAFMGSFDTGQTHGTLVASALVGQGKSLYYDVNTVTEVNVPNVFGMAPKTKVIAIANIFMSNIFEGWYFAVEGPDGIVGTGDEAVIASNSYGFSNRYPDGWDFYDRFIEWISFVHARGRTAFVVSAGNDGYGYGTVTTPAASTGVITVGASTDFGYRPQAGWETGPNPTWGDIVTYSSRGPTAMGKPDPDVVANGRMSFGSTALNQVTYAPNYDGSLASDLWAGTSLSAPTASGILALVYEAYRKSDHRVDNETIPDFTPVGSKNRAIMDHRPVTPGTFNLYLNGTLVPQANYVMFPGNGTLFLDLAVSSADVYTASYVFYDDYPDALTAKSLIMSSADDLNFDILSQGAGFVNAERATNLANSIDGIMVSPNTWSPGEFRGKKYPASVNLMTPGSYENKTFLIHNANSTSGTTVNITDAVFERMEEINYTVKTKSTVAHWSIVYMANYMKHNLSAPGIVNMTDNEEYWLADIDETVWLNTELLKISADSKQYLLDPNLDGTLDSQYWMDVYDWTCRRPCDSSGDYNPVTPGPAADFTGAELNRINVDHPDGNAMEVRIHNPAQRIHDGLWISLRPVLGDVEGIEFTITLEFYRKADWNWLETDKQVVLGPGDSVDGTKTFNANLSVPSGTSIGSYEGAMYLYENKGQSN
jgi:WD40 repeat protein